MAGPRRVSLGPISRVGSSATGPLEPLTEADKRHLAHLAWIDDQPTYIARTKRVAFWRPIITDRRLWADGCALGVTLIGLVIIAVFAALTYLGVR